MLSNQNDKIAAIILAAGQGKRMGGEKLKVMRELGGRPLIDFVIESVEKSIIKNKPVVVARGGDNSVQDYLGERAEYAIQAEQLGTGHAVATGEKLLRGNVQQVVVLYGDVPFVAPESINRLVAVQVASGGVLTLATTIVPDYDGGNSPFWTLARVERDGAGNIRRIVEKKDCTEAQSAIHEVNAGVYCFNAEWFWDNLRTLKNDNVQKEYYLTDLIALAIEKKEKISSISIDPREAIGINTKEDLEIAGKFI
ncbi:MAG: NTP transferase domain-containing protein [Patescibacteria group bacterium]